MRRFVVPAAVLLFAVLIALAHHDIPKGKEVLKLSASLGTVTFDHKAHSALAGVDCTACHHTFKMDSKAAPTACRTCHTKEAKGKVLKLMDAMHRNCGDCHQKAKSAGQKTGPLKSECKKCHVKA